jgi:hypothetical protein
LAFIMGSGRMNFLERRAHDSVVWSDGSCRDLVAPFAAAERQPSL